ncbi:uncharacterized protein LOC127837498 [Dreissena polymorpha]|uniref:CARD domain-containing protein n=1 Tax=Dreissena polymorpha TaxID=45954 RepID=A0A9D4FFD3_DREPO|nr:uncharacterized protein LOC127837498 [Dreissena polymorpha]KAH3796846.1 hypothetical protein DPMN_150421 [Dreissena polymorpha]
MSAPETITILKASVLNELRPVLCRDLTPENHFPYLRSRYILGQDDIDRIVHQTTKKQKADMFIEILNQKGQSGFDELVKSIIKERTQIFLAEKINKAFEEKMHRLNAIFNHNNSSSPVLDPEPSLGSSYRASQSPVEHCNSPEPEKACYSPFLSLESLRSSYSDLGVDTDKLPKPVMPDKVDISEGEKKKEVDDGCDFDKDSYSDSLKSVEIVIENSKESKA